MKTLKFSTAVLMAIREVLATKPTFSIRDVTLYLREAVNKGELAFSDKTPEDVDGITTYRVDHFEVKEQFGDLYASGLLSLTRRYAGSYFEYSAVPASASAPSPASSSPSVNVPIATSSVMVNQSAPDNIAILAYLAGCGKGSTISMKQIQSRFDSVRGVSCADYATRLAALNIPVTKNGNYPSKWTVTL